MGAYMATQASAGHHNLSVGDLGGSMQAATSGYSRKQHGGSMRARRPTRLVMGIGGARKWMALWLAATTRATAVLSATFLDDDESTTDGSFSTRFSASHLRVIANHQTKKKKEVISKGSFGSLLNISSFSVPADLLDWVVINIDPEKALFSHKQKSILFTKDMVRKIFNVPSGSRPVELLRRNEPHVLREPYQIGSRAPMKRAIDVLDGSDHTDVVTINRTWVLLCIALVLSPGTGNMVPLEYLRSLVDMDKVSEFAWDEHFLAVVLNEVKKYQKKREEGKSGFWIGGCLPMFAIIYMDFVDIPRVLVSDHRIRYSLPRACFVCNEDFDLLEAIDKNKLCLDKTEFGKRNLRRLAETPYVPLEGCNEAYGHIGNVGGVSADAHIPEIPSNPAMDGCDIGGDVCGSLDEWLHPLPSSQDLKIPSHLIPIYEKHKKLHAVEVNNAMKTFGKVLQSMFCNRMASILVEANATATSTKDHIPEDVTFHAPGGIASGAGHTRSPANIVIDREVAGSDSNQNEAHRDIGLDKVQSCDDQGKEFVQLGADNVEREEVATAEDVVADLKNGGVADEGRSLCLSQGTMATLDGLAMELDDGPLMSLFKEGTEDFEWLNMDPDTARKYVEAKKRMETTSLEDAPADVEQPFSAGPTYDNTPQRALESKPAEFPVQIVADGPRFDTDPKLHRPIDIPAPVFDASPIALADPLVPPAIVPVQQGHSEAELHNVGEKNVEDSSPRSNLVKKATT